MTIDQAIELLKSEPVVAFDADRYWNANDDEGGAVVTIEIHRRNEIVALLESLKQ